MKSGKKSTLSYLKNKMLSILKRFETVDHCYLIKEFEEYLENNDIERMDVWCSLHLVKNDEPSLDNEISILGYKRHKTFWASEENRDEFKFVIHGKCTVDCAAFFDSEKDGNALYFIPLKNKTVLLKGDSLEIINGGAFFEENS